jgi:tetratricopeptide (TPR) repeat protein
MKHPYIPAILLALATSSCDKPNAAVTTDGPTHRVEAEPFHGAVYRAFDGNTVLTLISRDECELQNQRQTLLCKYTKQPEALRVVVTAFGTNQVIYYRFISEGIQDNEGRILLSPESYLAAIERAREQREQAERARMESEQREREAERQRQAARTTRRDEYFEWIKTFFASGKTLKGIHQQPVSAMERIPTPITLAIESTEYKEDNDGPGFEVRGKVRWLGKKPDRVHNATAVQNHPVLIKINCSFPANDALPRSAKCYFYWWWPEEKQFIGIDGTAEAKEFAWDSNEDFVFNREPEKVLPPGNKPLTFDVLHNPNKISELSRLAESGNIDAQGSLGFKYLHGLDVAQDFEAAEKWLKKAAETNRMTAERSLAELYATCRDTKFQNGPKAVEYAERAFSHAYNGAWDCIDTLAVAYARNGNFEKAIEAQNRALQIVERGTPIENDPRIPEFKRKLNLYEQRKPYTAP